MPSVLFSVGTGEAAWQLVAGRRRPPIRNRPLQLRQEQAQARSSTFSRRSAMPRSRDAAGRSLRVTAPGTGLRNAREVSTVAPRPAPTRCLTASALPSSLTGRGVIPARRNQASVMARLLPPGS